MTLEELRAALAKGENVAFRGGAGQPIQAWGAKTPRATGRPATRSGLGQPTRQKRGNRPKKAAFPARVAAPAAPRHKPSKWERRAAAAVPWLLPLLWLLLVAASRTTGPGWLPTLGR